MYKKRTKYYNIPYISSMEMLEASEQEKAATIIDNMLYVATFGVDKAIFEDGEYIVKKETDGINEGLYTLTIEPKNGFSILGILNYCLFSKETTLTYEGLQSGNIYYIYVEYKTGLESDPESFIFSARTTKTISNSPLEIHIATIDLTQINGPTVENNPNDKRYISHIISHINANENPHGEILNQNTLNVKELNINGQPFREFVYEDITLEEGKSEYELNYEIGKNVEFVHVMHLSNHQNIHFDINNENLKIFSEGKAGKIKLKVEFK